MIGRKNLAARNSLRLASTRQIHFDLRSDFEAMNGSAIQVHMVTVGHLGPFFRRKYDGAVRTTRRVFDGYPIGHGLTGDEAIAPSES